jgi:hypothetical protein
VADHNVHIRDNHHVNYLRMSTNDYVVVHVPNVLDIASPFVRANGNGNGNGDGDENVVVYEENVLVHETDTVPVYAMGVLFDLIQFHRYSPIPRHHLFGNLCNQLPGCQMRPGHQKSLLRR